MNQVYKYVILFTLTVSLVSAEHRIVMERPDGFISVLIPAPKARLVGESDDAFIERIRIEDMPVDIVRWKKIDSSQLPTDRYFRNAWLFDIDQGAMDRTKCESIQRTHIKRACDKKLKKLKADFVDADIDGNETLKNQLRSQIQSLRTTAVNFDLNPSVAPTFQNLRNRWPVGLVRP